MTRTYYHLWTISSNFSHRVTIFRLFSLDTNLLITKLSSSFLMHLQHTPHQHGNTSSFINYFALNQSQGCSSKANVIRLILCFALYIIMCTLDTFVIQCTGVFSASVFLFDSFKCHQFSRVNSRIFENRVGITATVRFHINSIEKIAIYEFFLK